MYPLLQKTRPIASWTCTWIAYQSYNIDNADWLGYNVNKVSNPTGFKLDTGIKTPDGADRKNLDKELQEVEGGCECDTEATKDESKTVPDNSRYSCSDACRTLIQGYCRYPRTFYQSLGIDLSSWWFRVV